MDWKKTLGYGALLWVLMFVIISIFVGFGVYDLQVVKGIAVLIAGVISFMLAGYMHPKNIGDALRFAVVWVLIEIVLEAAVTMRFEPNIFYAKSLWAGYFLVLIAPLFRLKKKAA